jgi:hypothetical protein
LFGIETVLPLIQQTEQAMKITVGNIEGQTTRKGSKQNRVYTNVVPSDMPNFFNSEGVTLWNVNGDWTLLGIKKAFRMTYTKDFNIEY